MAEYIVAVATTEIGELEEKLAKLSIAKDMAKEAIKLTVSNSTSTQDLWFLPQDYDGSSSDKGAAFFGLASLTSQDMENPAHAIIENESDRMLILSADFETKS